MIKFYILVYFQGKEYCLRVEKTKITRDMEEYTVSGKNRSITLQTDAPLLRSRALKSKSASWRLIQGNAPRSGFLELIIKEIEMYSQQQ